MKTEPISAATIEFDAEGVPVSPLYGDRYHARAGAAAQAEHVFLRGNGLPARWAGKRRFVILETGFGLGHNFLATWAAWRRDAARCERLHYVAVDLHPPRREDLRRVHAARPLPNSLVDAAAGALRKASSSSSDASRDASSGTSRDASFDASCDASRDALFDALFDTLCDAWPPLTGDLHRLSFDDARVELLLAFGGAASWLRRLRLDADAIYLDGFAPERNPQMWSQPLFAALPALCADGATAATWSAARVVREGLASHGFEVAAAPGFAGKREMTVARFAPRYRPAPNARRASARPAARDALIVGAGLAGAAAAHALAAQGLAVTVLEAAAAPAQGASGNPAGLVRGIVARDDGAHARWHRAAALAAQRQFAPWIATGAVNGCLDGVLHLADDLGAMNALLERQGLPGDYVQACSAVEAGARAGVPCARPAWWFAGGGWIEPASFVRHALSAARAGSGVALRAGCRVASVEPRGARWLAFSARGELLGEADVIVLANAADAARLVPAPVALGWRLERSRGQVTRVPASTLAAWGQRAPWVPLAHHGYAIPLPDGSVLAGATQAPASDAGHADDAGDSREESAEAEEIEEGSVPRREDDLHNLEVFARLTGQALAAPWPAVLDSRVGYRCHSDDRLPVVGAVAALAGNGRTMRASELAQPRRVPRQSGLYVLTALGARGIASATLGAQVLAAWVAGSPMPIDTDLLDAVDAARHVSREARRRGANAADDG